MRQISQLFVASLALFLVVAEPAFAQSIDLSPIQSLLQGIVDALTGCRVALNCEMGNPTKSTAEFCP